MKAIAGYLELCRVSNLPTVWTDVLAACLLAGGPLPLAVYLLVTLALSSLYMAGMSLNDVCDVEHDRLNRPSRPIPAGRVSKKEALHLVLILFASGLILVGAAPHPGGFFASILLVALIVAYDVRHKDQPLSVLLMASCRFLVFVIASLALTGRLNELVALGGGIQFLYVLFISLVARRENQRPIPFGFPVVPAMLAGISLVDGIVMATLVSLPWLAAGMVGMGLTWTGQQAIRGD